ncbi:MAG: glutathione S-transferase, partial [Sulfitobacter sp.]
NSQGDTTAASLYPADRTERMMMVGLINEIAGENGFAWNARQLMLNATYQAVGDKAYKNPMLKDYQFDPDKVESVKASLNDFLAFLAKHLDTQPGHYLIGNQFSAADLYWAYFSNLLRPQAETINPMPGFLRKSYELTATLIDPFDESLVTQRDWIFDQHLETPLTF